MKKQNLKKLALLGITGGVALCSSATASELPNSDILNNDQAAHLLAANCGGGKCGNIAYQPRNSCSAAPQAQAYSSCSAAPQPQAYNSCSAAPQPQSYYAPSQAPQSSCRTAARPAYGQNQTAYQPAQSSCAGARPASSCTAYNSAPGLAQPQAYNSNKPAASQTQWENNSIANANTATTPASSTEDTQVLSQLNEEGKAVYRGLDPAGKALAQKLINQSCKGRNECKGLNACKTSDHSCAGKGSCKGTAPGPFHDKNQAVKIAAQKIAEKRASAYAPRANG